MKRFVLAMMILATATICARGDDDVFNFANHTLSFTQIEKEWQNQNLYTGSDNENPTIEDYFLGFSQAYPNDFMNMIVTRMLGREASGTLGDYMMDVRNGYLNAKLMAELELRLQMCYWRCSNGNILVGVSLSGDEYDPVATDDEGFAMVNNVNDLMFFEVKKGETVWWPRKPSLLTGRNLNFKDFNVELPRVGKDIKLSPGEDNPGAGNYLLKWDGAKFAVLKR